MRPIIQNGEQDFSDEGEQTNLLQSQAEVVNWLKGLTKRQKKIVGLKLEGYTHKEMGAEMKLNEKTIDREMSLIKKQYGRISL